MLEKLFNQQCCTITSIDRDKQPDSASSVEHESTPSFERRINEFTSKSDIERCKSSKYIHL